MPTFLDITPNGYAAKNKQAEIKKYSVEKDETLPSPSLPGQAWKHSKATATNQRMQSQRLSRRARLDGWGSVSLRAGQKTS